MFTRKLPICLTYLLAGIGLQSFGERSQAQTAEAPPPIQVANAVIELPSVLVTGESEYDEKVQGPFLPPVQGTKINSGKKTSVLDFDELPKINNNNFRQAITKTPGLLLSEETTPLVSIGYRGLPAHRTQFLQMLKDGVPIHADQVGYPEAYYSPPLDTVDRVEFIRGGASLMYGPQPGGAINFVTHRPRTDKPFSARTQHVFGTDDLYTTFNYVDGTIDRVGYYAYFNHRQTDGFREGNSDVALFAGSAKLVLDATTDSRWILSYEGYDDEHGEPGGLAIGAGPDYNVDREATTRFFDRFHLQRHFASLTWEKDFSENTALNMVAWGGSYDRFSKRQRGGGFGTLPTGTNANSNSIEDQKFYTEGLEARLRHDWVLGENVHTFAGGAQIHHTFSPRADKRGASADADDGQVRTQVDRDVLYAPVFMENRFVLGNFSITPGVRFENIFQDVEENVNLDKAAAGTPLGDESQYDFVPLLGIGVDYTFSRHVVAYANVSQSYRPKTFTETVPTGGTTFINEDLDEGKGVQYEIGVRGQPTPWLTWDTSLFWLDLDNQIGTVAVPGGTSLENVGRAWHRGWEAAGEVGLFGLGNMLCGRSDVQPEHEVSLYGNVMLLDAEFVSGPREGLTPQFAPDYLFRAGTIYRWRDRVKLALTGTFVDEYFADDANTPSFFVPSYVVWDLTLECKVYRNNVSILAGINNLFDHDYYARIRAEGIDPAYGRNYYAGVAFQF